MDKEIKLCVSLTDEVKTKLEYFDARRREYFTQSALFDVANILFASGQVKKVMIAKFIRENIEALVKEYAKEYPVWEYKALKYANEHKHGISSLIIKDIYYDKIWIKDFNKESQ
ncbi:MAG: hypothetical protein IJ859_03155 [Synergistaceae bacterium]|nr:hypothetical protein [Synergistaceae bacterium]